MTQLKEEYNAVKEIPSSKLIEWVCKNEVDGELNTVSPD